MPRPAPDSEDAALLLASFRRNSELLFHALELEGHPIDWLASWDVILSRLAGDAPVADCPAAEESPHSVFRRATLTYAAALHRLGLTARQRAYHLVMGAKEVVFRAEENAIDRGLNPNRADLRALGINAVAKLRKLCERFEELYRRGSY